MAAPPSIGALFFEQAKRHASRPLLRHRAPDACVGSRCWNQVTWQAAAQYVRALAHALLALKLEKGDRDRKSVV